MFKEKILVILPVLNEEGKIGITVSKVLNDVPNGVVDQVLVVNDGSDDNTVNEAEKAGAKVVSHEKNTGVGAAIRTGIRYAQEKEFDIIVVAPTDPIELRPITVRLPSDSVTTVLSADVPLTPVTG